MRGRCKFFLERDMETVLGRSFTKQLKQLLLANDKLFEGMELITSDLPLNTLRSSSKHTR